MGVHDDHHHVNEGLLIGESASEPTSRAIRAALDQQPEIHRIVELRTQHLGPETLLVAAKVVFAPDLSSAATASTIDEIERRIVAVEPSVRFVYLEPD